MQRGLLRRRHALMEKVKRFVAGAERALYLDFVTALRQCLVTRKLPVARKFP